MFFVILIPINSQFWICLPGKSFTNDQSKDGVYPIPLASSLSSTTTYSTQSTSKSPAISSITQDHVLLWHNILGHSSSRILHSAISEVCSSASLSQVEFVCSTCTYCISAKMHRFPLNKHVQNSTSPLELVHKWWLGSCTHYLFALFQILHLCRWFH